MDDFDALFVIPFGVGEGGYSVMIVLQDGNLERLRQYDPAEVNIKAITAAAEWPDARTLRDVIISYASPEDMAYIKVAIDHGRTKDVLRHLSRGFRYRPDRGDNDDPPVKLT